MKVLIDLNHPAHFHLFKNFAYEMIKKNHIILFTCRNKEFIIELLNNSRLPFITLGKKHASTLGKIWSILKYDLLETIEAIKFKPDIVLSHGSHYAAHAAFLIGKPHISFEDTFNFEQIWLYKIFTKVILTGDYDHPSLGARNLKYSGYHELAYLHPKIFCPNINIIQELGLAQNESFSIVRFVSWSASHDRGHSGITVENKKKLVYELMKFGKVFISSESNPPKELVKYLFPLSPEKMHDALSFASLFFGESATMATEAAVLGTPAIYIDNNSRFYTKEIEKKYNLIFNYSETETDQIAAIRKAQKILSDYKKEDWILRRKKLLNDKINVTKFLKWFICNYPESIRIMKNDAAFQLKFK